MENETIRNGPSGSERLARQRLHRRLMAGSLGGGVVLGLLLRGVLGYPLVGEAVYWLGVVGFLADWWGTPVTLFDERDVALERRASQLTLYVAGIAMAAGASAARVATYTDAYSVPTEVWTVLWGYVALFATFAVVYLWLRYRR